MRPEFSCCAVRRLPEHLRLAAAWVAATARPANAPGLAELVYQTPHDRPLPPESITLLRANFWPNGSRLRVAFKGGNEATNTAVLNHASLWSKWANIDFVGVPADSPCDIRVGYDQPGYWSNIGTDSRFVAQQGQTSLNLEGFDQGMPESEWLRVVCHEVGHALGAMHEQMRPEVVARLDRAKVHAWLRKTQGWSDAEIDQQMFATLDMSRMLSSVEEDQSVMMYQIPASVTIDGKGMVGGDHITDRDGQTMAIGYPGRGPVHPVVPPVPPAPARPATLDPAAVLAAVNWARAQFQLPSYAASPLLGTSAQAGAAYSAALGVLTHGCFAFRVASAHAPAAEDAAKGYTDPDLVVRAWLGDPAHKRNLFSTVYDSAGVGVAAGRDGTVYCFADFAKLRP